MGARYTCNSQCAEGVLYRPVRRALQRSARARFHGTAL
ncbi:hypothetical protein TPChic_1029a [Treponema pallidum subsp. pallidum str. Chicago]|nr:hypothetical protein TPChic_1029a [Treponema pallidum subsp. pallidum str. Chicago]